MELGGNPKAIGKDNITITKEGTETIVKVKVTSQNELETEEYEIVIMEKSSNCRLDTIEVNGKKATQDIDRKIQSKSKKQHRNNRHSCNSRRQVCSNNNR